ncbi:MAG: murein transglycosylase [Planctomycetes bacterium]|nr:murein transglycosylase [Planctomycetota bacterium]
MKHALPCILFLAVAGIACKTTPDYSTSLADGAPALIPLGPKEKVPDFSRQWEQRNELLPALENSLTWTRREHARQFFPIAGIEHERALASLERFKELLVSSYGPEDFQTSLVKEFQVYKSAGWNGRGGGVLFTAYCTPILRGSLEPTKEFRFPLYRLPKDLVKGRDGAVIGWETPQGRRAQYPARSVIEATSLLMGQELVWLADPIDAYLAHVNGSAFIELADGSLFRLGYAGKNGRTYTSLGKELESEGKIPRGQASLRTIRAWAASASTEELGEYLNRNQSYVFFTPIDGTPHGSLDVEVTAKRSLATDKSLFPRGALVFAAGSKEDPTVNRFLFDQDTGGAIRTAGRADLYLGIGPEAEDMAGRTKIEGQLYYLFLKEGAE